jgi:hypothetical protein
VSVTNVRSRSQTDPAAEGLRRRSLIASGVSVAGAIVAAVLVLIALPWMLLFLIFNDEFSRVQLYLSVAALVAVAAAVAVSVLLWPRRR